MTEIATKAARERAEIAAESRRVPQRAVSPYEYALYAVAFLMFVMAGAMPTAAIFVLPLIVPALYVLYRRFGAYLPTACVGFYGVFALTLNYDILTVAYLFVLCFAFFGAVLSAQVKPYLLCAAVAFASAVLGGFCGLGAVRLIENKPMTDIVSDYMIAERADPIVDYFARRAYENDLSSHSDKLDETDDGYADAVIEYFASARSGEIAAYLPYNCIHVCGIIGAPAYFAALFVDRRSCSPYDDDADEERLRKSVRCLGGAVVDRTPIARMKCPRSYLWAVLLPAFAVSLGLDIAGGYDVLSACIMHAFVTLPTAFFFITLVAFFAGKFKGRARVAAYVVSALVAATMCVFEVVLFACSVIGLCDVILDLRFWTDYLSKD